MMDMEIMVTGIGAQMQGVGRAADGRAVFVPGAMPGELVRVAITKERPRFLEARLVRVVRESPHRIACACPHASACGGCAAMHIDYAHTLSLKREKVVQALTRVGGLVQPPVLETIGMANPMRTRNKAEYAIDRGRIGLRALASHEIVEVDDCLLQHPLSVAAMRVTRDWLKGQRAFSGYLVTRVNRAGQLMCVLSSERHVDCDSLSKRLLDEVDGMASFYACALTGKPVHALDGDCHHVSGERVLMETLSGLRFALSPKSFFQVNTEGAERLFGAAVACAGLTGRETVIDAYCGAGTITLFMAREAGRAIGIEIVPEAISDAAKNARANGLADKAEFCLADAAKWLPTAMKQGLKPDVLSVDPPRKGVDAKLIDAIVRAKPARIVYVSCDPATLARDIKLLTANDTFTLTSAQPVDMFPWTHHVETVALITRVDK